MKRRHQRRAGAMVLAGAGVMIGTLAVIPASPAAAASGTGTVHAGGTYLNVRTGPSTATPKISTLPQSARVTVVCQTPGQRIVGNVRTTNLWNRLPSGAYVSDAYVRRAPTTLPRCSGPLQAPAVKAPAGAAWVTPVPATVGSGFRTKSRPTHDGIDLSAARNTPIRSIAAGTVTLVTCNASTQNCDVDGGLGVKGCGWYVEVRHVGQVISRYCHMVKRPAVVVGQRVVAGQLLGFVGSSGNSSGPHLHFEVHVNGAYADSSNAVDPVTFMRAKGVVLR